MVGPRWKDQGDIGTSIPTPILAQWLWNALGTPEGASRKAPKYMSFSVLNAIRAKEPGAPGARECPPPCSHSPRGWQPWGKGHQNRSLRASRDVPPPAKGSAHPEWELRGPQPGVSLSPALPASPQGFVPGAGAGWCWLRHHQSGHPDTGCPSPLALGQPPARLAPASAPGPLGFLERFFTFLREHHLGKLSF